MIVIGNNTVVQTVLLYEITSMLNIDIDADRMIQITCTITSSLQVHKGYNTSIILRATVQYKSLVRIIPQQLPLK